MGVKELAGLVSYGLYLPSRIVTPDDVASTSGIPPEVIVEKQGWRSKRVSEKGEMPTEMAVKASLKALEESSRKAGIGPGDIDAVLYVGSEFKDYGVWMAATKIQHDLGINRGFAFDITAMCVGMVLGLALAKRMDGMANNVLLVAASKESYLVREGDKDTTWLLDFADGASAVIVSKGYPRNKILESSFMSDGRFYGAVVVKDLGAVRLAEGGYQGRPYFESLMDKKELKEELGPKSREAFNRVIREAVELSGYSVKEIDLLVINHMKRSFHYKLVEDLGISPERAPYLEDYGHTQSSDMVIGLDIGLRKGLVEEGSLIVFASGGTGFLWGATALRWG